MARMGGHVAPNISTEFIHTTPASRLPGAGTEGVGQKCNWTSHKMEYIGCAAGFQRPVTLLRWERPVLL